MSKSQKQNKLVENDSKILAQQKNIKLFVIKTQINLCAFLHLKGSN